MMRNVRGFAILDQVCEHWVELVLSPRTNENLARGVHAHYVRHRMDEGPVDDPSSTPWDSLPPDLQESNRRQADDFKRKLQRLGYTFESALDNEPEPFEFSKEQIEELAQMEHDRWVSERLEGGWSYSEVKDVKAKKSPYLICWSCLDEATRDMDREAMRDFPLVLANEGFVIVPLDPPPNEPRSVNGRVRTPIWSCPTCQSEVDLPSIVHELR
jgi:hypothetical protein